MSPECGVYKILCAASTRTYVGSSVNLRKRQQKHVRELRAGTHHNEKLQRAWSKYGEAAFTFEVIESGLAKNELLAREQHWLDTLNAVDAGFNLSRVVGQPSGRLGRPHTEATKAKIRAKRALQVMSPEGVAKQAAALRGRPRSAEARASISAGKLGKKLSPEHCAAIAAARIAYVRGKQDGESA